MRALVFSIDDNYIMPFQVLFHSLLATESIPDGTPIFILHQEDLAPASIATLERSLQKYERKVTFVDVAGLIPDGLPLSAGDHVSKATFYRLFVATILPAHVTSVLYLDTDTIVIRSIRELFEVELVLPIAAVDHMSPYNETRMWGWRGGRYFQAGVIVIDVDYWRKNRCSDRFVDIIRKHTEKIKWWDQDILNFAFSENWQQLDMWFNVCQSTMAVVDHKLISENARLIHFDGSHKPWLHKGNRPFAEAWLKEYEETFGNCFEHPQAGEQSPGLIVWLARGIKSRIRGLIYGA